MVIYNHRLLYPIEEENVKAIVWRTYVGEVHIPESVFKGVDMSDEFAVRRAALKYFAKEERWPTVDSMLEIITEREVELS